MHAMHHSLIFFLIDILIHERVSEYDCIVVKSKQKEAMPYSYRMTSTFLYSTHYFVNIKSSYPHVFICILLLL